MELPSGPCKNFLIQNNINFYENNGYKYFETANYNTSNNSIVTLTSCFDEKYQLISANITIHNTTFNIKNYQDEIDLDFLISIANLSSKSLIFEFINDEYQILIKENDKIKPTDLDISFFYYSALKEDNYMFMDEIDRMINYIITVSSQKYSSNSIKPIDFQNIEKRFKNKIFTLKKIAS